jgi:hypothetical protein
MRLIHDLINIDILMLMHLIWWSINGMLHLSVIAVGMSSSLMTTLQSENFEILQEKF